MMISQSLKLNLLQIYRQIVDAVLNFLGWRHAMQGKKAVGFSAVPIALGVLYRLHELWSGQLTVSNKPGQVERILDLTKQLKKEATHKDCSIPCRRSGFAITWKGLPSR